MDKFEKFRADIPFLGKVVYLDTAAVCPPSRKVINAMSSYYENHPFNYGVGKAKIACENEAMVNRARESCAKFIGAASAEEIVLTKNTSEALNTVANGLKWQAGDQVIVSRADHQSNLIPWFRLRERAGISVTLLDVDGEGFVNPDDVKKAITKNTKLVTVTHGSNVTGAVNDVAAIAKIVKANSNALFMIDCAQTGGKVPIDVAKIDCDFAAFCGRKSLMGPQGTGFLYGKKAILGSLEPTIIGSRAAKTVDDGKFEYLGLPFRHESGVLNTSGVIGLGAAVEQLNEIGVVDIFNRVQDLSIQLLDIIREAGLKTLGASKRGFQCGSVSWTAPGLDCDKVSADLYDKGKILTLSGELGSRLMLRSMGVSTVVRTSLHCFNNLEDLEALKKTLKQVL